MEAEKLAAILTAHHLWRHTDGVEGTRANLYGAALYVSYFFQWQVVATSERMKIGCHDHDWADWKKHGAAYVKANGCEKEFKAWWPVADAARKWLVKRFPAKKPKPSGE